MRLEKFVYSKYSSYFLTRIVSDWEFSNQARTSGYCWNNTDNVSSGLADHRMSRNSGDCRIFLDHYGGSFGCHIFIWRKEKMNNPKKHRISVDTYHGPAHERPNAAKNARICTVLMLDFLDQFFAENNVGISCGIYDLLPINLKSI